MSGLIDDGYVTTRGEALPPPEPQRVRKARPTAEDNPRGGQDDRGGEERGARRTAEPDPEVEALSTKLRTAEERLAAAERERLQWQKERDELAAGKQQSDSRSVYAQKQALEAAIAAEDRRIESARQQYRAARESGDLDQEGKANNELADALVNRRLLDRDKLAWADWEASQAAEAEAAKTRPAARAADAQTQPQGLSPSDQKWAEEHPDFLSDPDCDHFVRAAADKAIQDGVVRGSPAFYRECSKAYDKFQDYRAWQNGEGERPQQRGQPQRGDGAGRYQDEEVEEPQAAPRRRPEPSASSMAPSPSRSSGREGGRGSNRVPSIEQVARRAGVDVADFKDIGRSFRGGLDGYTREIAKELGMI